MFATLLRNNAIIKIVVIREYQKHRLVPVFLILKQIEVSQ